MPEKPLFPEFATGRLSRPGDPDTAKAAGRAIAGRVPKLIAWAVRCVKETPGLTQRELDAKHCPSEPRKLSKRLAEAERRGVVFRGRRRRCSLSGREAETWYATEEARDAEKKAERTAGHGRQSPDLSGKVGRLSDTATHLAGGVEGRQPPAGTRRGKGVEAGGRT